MYASRNPCQENSQCRNLPYDQKVSENAYPSYPLPQGPKQCSCNAEICSSDQKFQGMPGCRRCRFLSCKCGPCKDCRIYSFVKSISQARPPNPKSKPNVTGGGCGSKNNIKPLSSKRDDQCCEEGNNGEKMKGSKQECEEKAVDAKDPNVKDKQTNKPHAYVNPKDLWPNGGGSLITEYRANFQPPKCRLMPVIARVSGCKETKYVRSCVQPCPGITSGRMILSDYAALMKPPWNNSSHIPPPMYRGCLEAEEAKLRELDRLLQEQLMDVGEAPHPLNDYQRRRQSQIDPMVFRPATPKPEDEEKGMTKDDKRGSKSKKKSGSKPHKGDKGKGNPSKKGKVEDEEEEEEEVED